MRLFVFSEVKKTKLANNQKYAVTRSLLLGAWHQNKVEMRCLQQIGGEFTNQTVEIRLQ